MVVGGGPCTFCLSPPSTAPQVLRGLLLPADAGHGEGLRGTGGRAEGAGGGSAAHGHRPLLLLLPLLPPTQALQVRGGNRGSTGGTGGTALWSKASGEGWRSPVRTHMGHPPG